MRANDGTRTGGEILVESQIAKGSKFTLRLPVRSTLSLDMTGTGFMVPPTDDV